MFDNQFQVYILNVYIQKTTCNEINLPKYYRYIVIDESPRTKAKLCDWFTMKVKDIKLFTEIIFQKSQEYYQKTFLVTLYMYKKSWQNWHEIRVIYLVFLFRFRCEIRMTNQHINVPTAWFSCKVPN